ncbi:sensor histidine kinase [Catenuloplanes sp. NPDC051500]|uniref:sensor histidine kinase n=1 Tax=Catenuloplanes sp. NPDC051500 TaxID=3363959 RepID=UPI0037B51E7F
MRAGVSTAAERLAEIVGLLWAEEPERRIEELIVRATDAGMAVTLSVEDEPVAYEAAHAVVREALTNAAKHAPGASVEVLLLRDSVVVRNTPPPVPPAPASGTGHGLAGLRERVGDLRAGPTPDGGFEVVARLPAPADPPGSPATALHHRTSRGRTLAVGAPAGLVLAVVGTLMALYAYDSGTSRLAPAQFRALPLGAARADLAELLPSREVPERRDRAGPAGTDCEYYRSSAGPFPRPFDVYRLCFRDGTLVAKDVLPPE